MNYIKIYAIDIITNMSLLRSDYQTHSQTQSQTFELNIFNPPIARVVLKPLDILHAGQKGARDQARLHVVKFCLLSFMC